MFWTVVFAIFVFSVIIFVHELGHFIFARVFGVTVHEFAIGMGPKIFSWRKDKIMYSVRAIPMGGFCAMEGENGESDDEGALGGKPWYQRLVILAAGAGMNVILGFIISIALITVTARMSNAVTVPSVGSVYEASDAAEFLKEGDRIVRVGNTRVNIVRDINFALQQNGNKPINITVKRDGRLLSKTVKPYEVKYTDGTEGYVIGFTPASVSVTPLSVVREAFYQTIWMGKIVFVSLGMMFNGKAKISDMSGPVGVVSAMNESAQAGGGGIGGLLNLLFLSGFISVNLGIVNLLPIPALDGGRIFFTLIEAVRRKPIPPEKEGIVHLIGFALLIALMLFATWNDILRLFS